MKQPPARARARGCGFGCSRAGPRPGLLPARPLGPCFSSPAAGRAYVEARGLTGPKSLVSSPNITELPYRPPSDRQALRPPGLAVNRGPPVSAGGGDAGQRAAQSGHSEVAA